MTSSRTLFLLSVLGLASACSSAPGNDASSVVGSGGETANTPGTGAGSSGTTTVTPVGGSGSGSAGSTTTGGTTTAAMNVLPVSVNGTQCAPDPSGSYPNKPCVTVTVCVPGTSTCQTIPDILLDTGSFGLRVFHQVLTIPLTKIATSGGTLTECVQYGGGMSDWGPIARADVVLGGEPAVTVPMQIIDSTFGVVSASACPNMEVSPTDAQMNGVLGVGVFAEDCGPMCTISASNHLYYSCTASACTGVTVPLSNQVTTPVTSLPIDNNGLIVQLPAVSAAGA